MATDSDNTLWYRSYRYIVNFDGVEFSFLDSSNSPLKYTNNLYSFYHDKVHQRFIINTSPTGMPTSSDSSGVLWLFDIKNKTWKEIEIDIDVPEKLLITSDKYGNLFLGKEYFNKIYVIPLSTTNPIQQIITIPLQELVGTDFVPLKSLFINSKNNLWIGTSQNGVIKTKLDSLIPTNSINDELYSLPNIWIRSVKPNPIINNSLLEIFIEPSYLKEIKKNI